MICYKHSKFSILATALSVLLLVQVQGTNLVNQEDNMLLIESSNQYDFEGLALNSINQCQTKEECHLQTFNHQEQSNAAVTALIKWVLELDTSSVELITGNKTDKYTDIVLNKEEEQYRFHVRQLQYNHQKSLYLTTVTYPTRVETSYYIFVNSTGNLTSEVSILHAHIDLIHVSYKIELSNNKENIFGVKSIKEIKTTTAMRYAVKNYRDIIIPQGLSISHVTKLRDDTSNLTKTTVNITFVKNASIESNITQDVYTFSHLNKTYNVFSNNTIINAESNEVILDKGAEQARQWIIKQALSSFTIQPFDNFSIYTNHVSGNVYYIYNNGTVLSDQKQVISTSGLSGLINNLFKKQTKDIQSSTPYQIYQVVGSNLKCHVLQNGKVYTEQGKLVSNDSIAGLKKYLTTKITWTYANSTVNGKQVVYQLATDLTAGIQYKVYQNGSVMVSDTKQVATEGARGLINFIVRKIVMQHVDQNVPTYKLIKLHHGITYYLHDDGQVQTKEGQVIAKSLDDFKVWVNQKYQTNVKFTIEKADYLVIPFNGTTYYQYTNDTIIDSQNNIITKVGIHGFKDYIANKVSQTKTKVLKYQLIQDKTTGKIYHVYDDGTVISPRGKFICDQGYQGLKEYLFSLQDKDIVDVYVQDTRAKEISMFFKTYADKQGNQFWVTEEGLIYNPRTEKISMVYELQEFVRELTYLSSETKVQAMDYFVATVNNSTIVYHINDDGSVFTSDDNFICTGGVLGLIRYLTVKKNVKLRFEEDFVYVDAINKQYQQLGKLFLDSNGYAFCVKPTKDESIVCFYNYLALKYYQQLSSTVTEKALTQFKDHMNITYNIYRNGKVTKDDGTFIVDGGKPALLIYLEKLYSITSHRETKIVDTTYHIYVFNGVQLIVYTNGTCTTMDNKIVLQEGGVEALRKYLISRLPEHRIVQFKNKNYRIFLNGTVTENNFNTISLGGIQGLADYLEATLRPEYDIVVFKDHLYTVFRNGSVGDDDGNRFIKEGGVTTLQRELVKRENNFTVFTFNNVTYKLLENNTLYDNKSGKLVCTTGASCLFDKPQKDKEIFYYTHNTTYKIYLTNGTVTEQNGYIVLKSGGLEALLRLLENCYKFELVKVINGTTYRIYRNGTVIEHESKRYICEGGRHGLDIYLLLKAIPRTERVYHNDDTYIIYANGTVVLQPNKLILRQGGYEALKKYLSRQIPNNITLMAYGKKYYLYKNGTTLTPAKAFISSGSTQGFINYLTSLKVDQTYQIFLYANKVYHSHQNGTVTDDKGKVIVKTGGMTEFIKLILQSKKGEYQVLNIHNQTFRIYNNGTATNKNGVFICNGGFQCIVDYLAKFEKLTYNFKGTNYYIYKNATVMSEKKQLISKAGGLEALKKYLKQFTYDAVDIDDITYRIYLNSSVYQEPSLKQITKGGLPALRAILDAKRYSTHIYKNQTYRIYVNGTVTGKNNAVILKKGGLEAFIEWLKTKEYKIPIKQTEDPKAIQIKVEGRTYYLYNNGAVYDANHTFITHGGEKALKKLLLNILLPEYTIYNMSGVIYKVYKNGTVTDNRGFLILRAGGVEGLMQWLKSKYPQQVIPLKEDNRYIQIKVDGKKHYLHKNASIYNANNTRFTDGSDKVLKEMLLDILLPEFQSYNVSGVIYRVYQNGTVTDNKNHTLIKRGGVEALIEYLKTKCPHCPVHIEDDPRFITIKVNGIKYYLHQNASVHDGNNTKIRDGRDKTLKELLLKILLPDYTIHIIDGVKYRVYKNDSVTDDYGHMILKRGGLYELKEYLELQRAKKNHYTLHIVQGTRYHIYKNGTVNYGNETFYCHKCFDCLFKKQSKQPGYNPEVNKIDYGDDDEDDEEEVQDKKDEEYKHKFNQTSKEGDAGQKQKTNQTGQGVIVKVRQEVSSELDDLEDDGKLNITIQGVRYIVYKNGTVFESPNKQILSDGGMDALKDYLCSRIFDTAVFNNVKYIIFRNGTVYQEKPYKFIVEGGLPALKRYLQRQRLGFKIYHHEGQRFKVWSNGTVFDNKHKMIIKQGGLDALTAWLLGDKYQIVHGNDREYRLYPNGTITYDCPPKFVCQNRPGQIDCLMWWLLDNTPEVFNETCNSNLTTQPTIQPVGQVKEIDIKQRKVSDLINPLTLNNNGLVLSGFTTNLLAIGDENQFETQHYILSQQVADDTELVISNGRIFNIYSNGDVYYQGIYICNGGKNGLNSYIQSLEQFNMKTITTILFIFMASTYFAFNSGKKYDCRLAKQANGINEIDNNLNENLLDKKQHLL